jgi:hypothetical protein
MRKKKLKELKKVFKEGKVDLDKKKWRKVKKEYNNFILK